MRCPQRKFRGMQKKMVVSNGKVESDEKRRGNVVTDKV